MKRSAARSIARLPRRGTEAPPPQAPGLANTCADATLKNPNRAAGVVPLTIWTFSAENWTVGLPPTPEEI